jgi:membrane protein EpsK
MSGWVLLDQLGTLLFLGTELILVNKLCGSEATGRYAIILSWVLLLRAMVDIVSSTLTPMYFTYYAKGEMENIVKLLKKSIKFLGLIIALPVGLICGFASSLLTVWVGANFAGLAPLMWILVGHLVISLAIMPAFAVQVTFNKVRTPAIVTLFMGLGVIIIAVFFTRFLGWGIYGIAVASAGTFLLRNICFTSLYVGRILKIKLYTCIIAIVPGVLLMFVVLAAAVLLNHLFKPTNWFSLISYCIFLSFIYALLVHKFVIKAEDRKLFLSILPLKWQKLFRLSKI